MCIYGNDFGKGVKGSGIDHQNSSIIVDYLIIMMEREKRYLIPFCDTYKNLPSTLKESWRRTICLWSFRVVDHFSLPRETVAMSMSHYDRFLWYLCNTCSEPISSECVSLISLTTLFLSTKLQRRSHVSIEMFSELSAFRYSVHDIALMETKIISALEWRLNPPTHECFVGLLLEMIPISQMTKKALFQAACYNTQTSICDKYLSKLAVSTVAVASILAATECINVTALPLHFIHTFMSNVATFLGIDCNSPEIDTARKRVVKNDRDSQIKSTDSRIGHTCKSPHQFYRHLNHETTCNLNIFMSTSQSNVTI